MNTFDIAVAVSGGLDSLMALCLLKEAGHKLLAVHAVFVPGKEERLASLRQACDSLKIPLESVDLSAAFAQKVVEPFVAAYSAGATPNPCVVCNREMKFGLLLETAQALGCKRLATGHYARLTHFRTGQEKYLTFGRAADASKDQAYFLGLVPPENLKVVIFPLADYHKKDLRLESARRGLLAPESRESQEICFIPNDDYRAFLRKKCLPSESRGPMLLPDGRRVGEHHGLWSYTEGQRRGLGIAHSEPLYVIGKDMARNALLLGLKDDLYVSSWRAEGVNFYVPPQFWPPEVVVRTRYRQAPQPAEVTIHSNTLEISFLNPHERPAPGQLVVVYDQNGLMLAAGVGGVAVVGGE